MRPTAVEMIQCVEFSLDADVVPNLGSDPRAHSAVASIRFLLRHLAVRVEVEPRMLAEDSRDIRELCVSLVEVFRSAGMGELADLVARECDRIPPVDGFPDLCRLSKENTALKTVVDKIVSSLGKAENYPSEPVSVANTLIAQQLARQIGREEACMNLTYTGSIF